MKTVHKPSSGEHKDNVKISILSILLLFIAMK